MTWKPATIEEVKAIVAEESRHFDAEQAAIYERCRVEPVLAKLFRYDQWESVVIVARNGDRVIYWKILTRASTNLLQSAIASSSTGAIRTCLELH
jgi:hypothetical protein